MTKRRRQGAPLFAAPQGKASSDRAAPLAERMRPRTLDEFVGQEHLLGPGGLLREMAESGEIHSLLLWGPPGCGKTTLAELLARSANCPFVRVSAVLAGVAELREIVDEAEERLRLGGRPTVLFVDEIHRFNKAQQEAFLPHVERGTIVLLGATTENPSFEVVPPLLSRLSVLVLRPLAAEEVKAIVHRALLDEERGLGKLGLELLPEAREFLVEFAQGDARVALNTLEVAARMAVRRKGRTIDLGLVEKAAQRRALLYDKAGEEHYNVVSAFIKSLRGSDPDAAVYWLLRMLEAGEDPLFVARRMVVFASEDVGNADPRALSVAVAAKEAVDFVGMPEGRLPLTQAALYLAAAPKSHAVLRAMQAAEEDVKKHGALPVPLHLRNAPTPLAKAVGYGAGYRYPHDFEGHVVAQVYLPEKLAGRRYYEPSEEGEEREIARRLRSWREKTSSRDES
ncbi:MAG: ATPase AAA [Candidatus Binatia bacterium]|nr:MAG: ATPase AAA [Candidatus Binatia bacterium]